MFVVKENLNGDIILGWVESDKTVIKMWNSEGIMKI